MKLPYGGLLKIREAKEKEKLMQFSKISGDMEKARRGIAEYYTETDAVLRQQAMVLKSADGIAARQLHDFQLYLTMLAKRKEAAERKIKEIETEYEEKKSELLEARKQRRIIEILREKKKAEWDYNVQRSVANELDEFNQKRKR